MGTPDYPKKRHIAKRTVTTRLFTDDEREVQRRVTHEGKDRSEILRQAVSNAFRTERLALARKDETMQPVIDTYRKFMDEATATIKNNLRFMQSDVERMWLETRKAFAGMEAMRKDMETVMLASRYNAEQTIVMRAMMKLYMINVHEQLELKCGMDAPLMGKHYDDCVMGFQHQASGELARIVEECADTANQPSLRELLAAMIDIDKPILTQAEQDATRGREPRW